MKRNNLYTKNYLVAACFFLAFLLANTSAFSQEMNVESDKEKTFGIGVDMAPLANRVFGGTGGGNLAIRLIWLKPNGRFNELLVRPNLRLRSNKRDFEPDRKELSFGLSLRGENGKNYNIYNRWSLGISFLYGASFSYLKDNRSTQGEDTNFSASLFTGAGLKPTFKINERMWLRSQLNLLLTATRDKFNYDSTNPPSESTSTNVNMGIRAPFSLELVYFFN